MLTLWFTARFVKRLKYDQNARAKVNDTVDYHKEPCATIRIKSAD